MASHPGINLAITTGVAALFGGYAAWKLQSEYKKLDQTKQKDLSEVVHLVRVEDVGSLLDSDDLEIRQAAEKFLLERATNKMYLPLILESCLHENRETVVKAVTAVFLLCKTSNQNKHLLCSNGALKILSKVLSNLSDGYQYKILVETCKYDVIAEEIFSRTVGSIFHLSFNDTSMAMEVAFKEKRFVRDICLHILSDHGFHILTDVKRWSTYIIHQLVQTESGKVKKALRKWGVVTKTSLCLIRTLGDVIITQLCLQILVQYLHDTPAEIIKVCQEMASLGLLPHLVGLLRCEEEENVVQISAIIIHHFCWCDIDVHNVLIIPGIAKILFTVLNSSEAVIQKTILRIYNYLSVNSSAFQKKLLKDQPLLKRLSVCLASGNHEVVQGSLMLIHDLAMPGKSAAQKIVMANPDILKSLVSLAISSSGEAAQLIAETLGFFCSCEALHSVLLKQGVINAILHFAKSDDMSVQFWASALLLNLSMISDETKVTIIRSGGLFVLLELAVNGDEVEMPDIALNATKAMVIMGFLDASIDIRLLSGLDGSIKVDGTEYCPGKQGINSVSLDFMNYKFSKGKVLQPQEVEGYVRENHLYDSKKCNPVFFVTQGDCTVVGEENQEHELQSVFKKVLDDYNDDKYGGSLEFLKSPVWALCLEPRQTHIQHGADNLKMDLALPMEHCISAVVKNNFTDPLIGVLLSYAPSSSFNKSEDLELIEILARHSFQRKAIISASGFLEFLHEMLWAVISLKVDGLLEPANSTKLSNCIAALKVLHLCSIDGDCVKELVGGGILRVLLCLLHSLTPFLLKNPSKNIFTFVSSNDKENESTDQKQKQRQQHVDSEDEKVQSQDPLAEDLDYPDDPVNAIPLPSLQFDTVTSSNDNIFYEEDEEQLHSAAGKTVHFDVSHSQQADHDISSQRPPGRMRADSYIMRSNTLNRNRAESTRTETGLDQSIIFDAPDESQLSTSCTPSHKVATPATAIVGEVTANHQQMRRISRSMSVSLQHSKTDESKDGNTFQNTDEAIKQLSKQALLIACHIISNSNEHIFSRIVSYRYMPVLISTLLSHEEQSFRDEIGLLVSTAVLNCQQFLNETCQDVSYGIHRSHIEHVGAPYSLILSGDRLSVQNENWFFESVRGNQPVTTSLSGQGMHKVLGWYYEITVHTSGIMQLGWANADCKFNPEKGIGVGDTVDSCGFDGTRRKVWSGPSRDIMVENDYGIVWKEGDVVSVLLSWDGVASFWLNGKDLGPALSNVDTKLLWYPAASLSVGQRCTFVFNARDMKYKALSDFVTIGDVYDRFHADKRLNVFDVNLNDSIKLEEMLESGISHSTVYFFEVDLSAVEENIKTLTIGYIYHHPNSKEKEKSTMHVYKRIVKDIDIRPLWYEVNEPGQTFKHSGITKTIGCGIVLYRKTFIITCGNDVACEIPLQDMFGVHVEFKDELILNLIPYLSLSNININYGQTPFCYQPANSMLSKYKFTSLVSDIIDRDDTDSPEKI